MVSIRHKYHYGNVTINPNGVITGKALTGNNIPAQLKDGSLHYRPFAGILDDDLGLHQPVKLVNITAIWWDDSAAGNPDIVIPERHFLLGTFYNDSYYITLRNREILTWPRPNEKQVRKNNVVSLFPHKNQN